VDDDLSLDEDDLLLDEAAEAPATAPVANPPK
jgi:hypothetical protein